MDSKVTVHQEGARTGEFLQVAVLLWNMYMYNTEIAELPQEINELITKLRFAVLILHLSLLQLSHILDGGLILIIVE